jgi:hypothetical protein
MPRRVGEEAGRQAVAACRTAWRDGTEPDLATIRTAVRWTLQLLADAAPGRSVEVRVPPVAAVQCIAGPRHTRGTPPNTIETDPRTWLDLASGDRAWPDAVRSGAVRASGVRADLTAWLPIALVGD